MNRKGMQYAERGITKNMRIVIYSNDTTEAKFYEALCRELGEKYHISVELKLYDSSDTLLFDLGDPEFCKRLDVIYFALDKHNTDIPALIRDAGYTNLIVFIGGEEMIVPYEQLFDAEAYNFVQNSRTAEHLQRFADIFQKAGAVVARERTERLVLSYGGEIRQIDISHIHYFEVQKHILIIHYGNGENFSFISSLSKMEQHLKGRKFMRVSRFYLISLNAVQKITANSAIMCDGTDIPVGRKFYAELKSTMEKKADWA